MPKASPIQTSFSAGEVSPLVQGRFDNERYKQALGVCLNYFPTLQGPLIRRPGTKYIADVKDPSKPPTLIPFQFSANQSYMLEFGEKYIRFYTNEGQIITNTTVWQVSGICGFNTIGLSNMQFNAVRPTTLPKDPTENLSASSALASGVILELVSPYTASESKNLKFAQSADTLFIAHSSYMTFKLQRFGQYEWSIKPILFKDGPFLPLNSYSTINDSSRISLTPSGLSLGTLTTGPNYNVYGAAAAPGTNWARVTTSAAHAYSTGDRVFISGVVGAQLAGAISINNGTSSVESSFYVIQTVDATNFDLMNTTFLLPATNSTGTVAPAMFELNKSGIGWADSAVNRLRTFALLQDGYRYWGVITGVTNPSVVNFTTNANLSSVILTKTWQMGKWSPKNGYPGAVCLHQDRLGTAGAPGYPQGVDLSVSSNYENMAASGSTLQVADNNSVQLNLASAQSNPINWVKSSSEGLLAGSVTTEWLIAPNNLNAALTPTNVTASPTSFFGSANVDAVQAGNATLYVQGAYRKIREMNYFYQVGTFRSTDLSELSEHITIPTVTKLAVQKEPFPLVWGLRADGTLLSMTYSRDDQTIKAGWARHILGGQSDSGGTQAQVNSIGVITASSATFDQLWMTTKRFINGTSSMSIEIMTTPYNDSVAQEDAYCLDNGITFENPKAITNLTSNGSAVVTCVAHGFNNGSSILVTDLIGLNLKSTDVNGNVTTSNLVNEQTFIVASTTANTFYLQDFQGNFINGSSYSSYFSGGIARRLVTKVSGFTWLKGETVGVLADGGIHPDVIVDSSGVLVLSYPAAKIQVGYRYNSDASNLRTDAGAADGSSIGKLRRITYAAFFLHSCGDFSFGPDFSRLLPMEFARGDANQADIATPLFSGLTREGLEASYDFDDNLCWRQNSPLPGMVQSVTVMMDEFDV